ncbi:DUF2842 domain-containing protein [Parasphingorhabdus sp.]|uniref:DUF2842 domain-containing protein n=1 Tax=Parasphingorhabdus sp. TaxID=2709688 RepID=UPI003D2D7AA5
MTDNANPDPSDEPNWRQPVGILLILFLLLIWLGISVNMIDWIGSWNFWLQLPVYIILGIAWIYPIRPLLIWMNTGSWRHFPQNKENGASDET